MAERVGMLTDKRLALAALIPRFYLGVIFLMAVIPKVTAERGFATQLGGYLHAEALQAAPAWYQAFVQSTVLPHLGTFAFLDMAGEIFVALTLLAGLFTRAGAVVAILLLANYMTSKGMPVWAPASNDAADIMLALVVFLTDPGRIFGLDRLRGR